MTCVNKTERKQIEKKYGLSVRTNSNGDYIENPFFKLYDQYKFDIFQDSVVDLFHITLIGLLPTVLAEADNFLERRKRDEIASHINSVKINNSSLSTKDKEYWNGDMWL